MSRSCWSASFAGSISQKPFAFGQRVTSYTNFMGRPSESPLGPRQTICVRLTADERAVIESARKAGHSKRLIAEAVGKVTDPGQRAEYGSKRTQSLFRVSPEAVLALKKQAQVLKATHAQLIAAAARLLTQSSDASRDSVEE